MFRTIALALSPLVLLFGSAGAAETIERVPVGTLTCTARTPSDAAPEGTKALSCAFRTAKTGAQEFYKGAIKDFADGERATAEMVVVWTAWAPADKVGELGILVGDYVGIAVDDPRAAGIGAHLLIGGAGQSVLLQPVLRDGEAHSDLVASISVLELRPNAI